MASQILNSLQVCGVNKVGNIYCPENQPFPKFSETGCIHKIDILLNEIPEQDLNDLKLLLTLLGILPCFLVRGIIGLIENKKEMNGEIGNIFRQIRFGLRGIVFSLYYSEFQESNTTESQQTPIEILGYKVSVN